MLLGQKRSDNAELKIVKAVNCEWQNSLERYPQQVQNYFEQQ